MLELLRSLFVLCWLTLLPGFLITRFVQLPRFRESSTAIAIYLAVGISFWPLLLLWLSVAGFQLAGQGAWLLTMLWCGLGFLLLFNHLQPTMGKEGRLGRALRRTNVVGIFPGLLLFLFALWTRVSHAENLVMPNWVDSIHHAMIVRVLVENGHVADTFAPFMPSGQFLYHWGYHALMAWLAWLQGRTDSFEIVQGMLSFGQSLSTLTVFMLYVAGRWLFNSRRAGLFVAIFGGLVSWFPAYYISWGRYTHLMGVLLMAPLCYSLWRCHTDEENPWGWGIITTLLAAGLLLIHVRVAVFVAIWAMLLGLYLLWQRQWRSLMKWMGAGIGALLLTLPWFWRLLGTSQTSHLAVIGDEAQATWWSAINEVAWSLLWVPGVHELMLVATGGIASFFQWGGTREGLLAPAILWLGLTALAICWYGWQRLQRKQRAESPVPVSSQDSAVVQSTLVKSTLVQPAFVQPGKYRLPTPPIAPLLLILGWCGATILLLNLDKLGLPTIGFLNNNAAVITFFAPVSLFAGGVAAWVSGALIPRRWLSPVMIVVALVLGGWGSYQMRTIVNPTTVLVHDADMDALRWIRESTPPDALFAVSIKPWLGDTYAGSDAGYWISVMSDRDTILPPALYTSVMPYDDVLRMNRFFATWSQRNGIDDPQLRQQLLEMGVTHIYLGSRGGHLVPPNFFDKPYVKPVYSEGGVFIYELLN